MPRKEEQPLSAFDSQQKRIELMDIGDTISTSRRIDMTGGLDQKLLIDNRAFVRSTMDQQAQRARRKMRPADYIVELTEGLTRAGALIITAAITRVR